MTTRRTMVALTVAVAVGAASALSAAETPRIFTLTTKSDAARVKLRELQDRVKSFQGGPPAAAMAREILELDPEFAMAMYYLSATTPAPDNQKHLDRAVELSKKASEGERRFIEAMVLARGKTPADAVEPLRKLAADYPGERVVYMLLGQNLAGLGRHDEARAAYEQAIKLSDRTPRAHSLLGNYHLMKGDYAKALEYYTVARVKMPKGVAPAPPATASRLPISTRGTSTRRDAHCVRRRLQERDPALRRAARGVHLELDRPHQPRERTRRGGDEGLREGLRDRPRKQALRGRQEDLAGPPPPRPRADPGPDGQARRGLEGSGAIRQMIAEGGERGKQFEPAYHYIAGYLKLEAGETAAAIEHLTQADIEDDPFHKLLLARAYDKAGRKDEAKKLYTEIVNFPQSNLERALAYREARKRLATL